MPQRRGAPAEPGFCPDHFGSSMIGGHRHAVVGDNQLVDEWGENARPLVDLEAAAAATSRGEIPSIVPVEERADGHQAREMWRQDAIEQLANLDADAREDGLEPPLVEARDLAMEFISEFARYDLPLATVSADEDRGVSIQMEVTGFFSLLTCFGDGSGLCNVARPTHLFEGPFRAPPRGSVAESEFMQDLRCLIRPLTNHAVCADRRK